MSSHREGNYFGVQSFSFNLDNFPHQPLIRNLYQHYYGQTSFEKENHLSSHWQFCTQHFDVRITDNKYLHLRGYGFGNQAVVNHFQNTVNWISHATHAIHAQKLKNILYITNIGLRISKKMGLAFSSDCFKQILSLELIMQYLPLLGKKKYRVLIIGDGYGFMAALIKEIFPASTIFTIDLGKVLLFQTVYNQLAHPTKEHRMIDDLKDDHDHPIVYCTAENRNQLQRWKDIDIAINIASMQEMNSSEIRHYFDTMRSIMSPNNLFYCCNREKKILMGGEISELRQYPYLAEDAHYIDEYCPWYKYYLTLRPYGGAKGPRWFGIRFPFIQYFDGPFIHRLTKLKIF